MPGCPACARPVAVARPTCLYCGAALPPEIVPGADAGGGPPSTGGPEPATADAATARAVVVIEPTRADAARLGRALDWPAYAAGQCVQRGGWQLLRVGAPPDDAEAGALAWAGARVEALPESEVRAAARPLLAAGGSWSDGRLRLRTVEGPLALGPGELLLLVRGPIVRRFEVRPVDLAQRRLAAPAWRRLPGSPEPGERIHLHRRGDPRPVELDPQAFEFGREPPREAPLVALRRWSEALAAGAPVDDAFRHVTPALGPVPPESGAAADLVDALRRQRGGRSPAAPALLDNLAQFRFYSAWRGCVERRPAAGQLGSFPRPRKLPRE